MRKIICKSCGEISSYCMYERVHRYLFFNADGEPDGSSEDVEEYASDVKRCPYCDKKVKIVEEGET